MFKAPVFEIVRGRTSSRAALLTFLAASLPGCLFGSGGGSSGFGVTGKAKFGVDSTITVDRIQLFVSAAAVTNPIGINIQVQSIKQVPAMLQYVGPRFTLLPGDTAFAAPITIHYHYSGLKLPEGVTENQLQLAAMGPTGLLTILPTVISADDDTATTTTTTFFTLALVAPAGTPPSNGTGELLFLRKDAGGENDLWKSASNGGGPSLVIAHTAGEVLSSPRLSTSAQRVAFTETSGGAAGPTSVFIANLDGTGRTQVTADGSIESVGDLSADGNLLYVTHRDSDSALPDLAVYNLSGAAPFSRTLLTNTADEGEQNPRISPDGQTLVFQNVKGELRRMSPVAGAAVKVVTSKPVVSFSWSPDSKRLIVQRPVGTAGGFGFGGGIGEISPFTSSFFFPVIKGTGGARRPTYSPNGENLIFEFEDSDPAVSKITIRQIPRKGDYTPLLLGGSSSVFEGESPVARP